MERSIFKAVAGTVILALSGLIAALVSVHWWVCLPSDVR